jgi:hypothetical protein
VTRASATRFDARDHRRAIVAARDRRGVARAIEYRTCPFASFDLAFARASEALTRAIGKEPRAY